MADFLFPVLRNFQRDYCISIDNMTFGPVTKLHTQQGYSDENTQHLLLGSTTPEFFRCKDNESILASVLLRLNRWYVSLWIFISQFCVCVLSANGWRYTFKSFQVLTCQKDCFPLFSQQAGPSFSDSGPGFRFSVLLPFTLLCLNVHKIRFCNWCWMMSYKCTWWDLLCIVFWTGYSGELHCGLLVLSPRKDPSATGAPAQTVDDRETPGLVQDLGKSSGVHHLP